jgi:hypothetical protein
LAPVQQSGAIAEFGGKKSSQEGPAGRSPLLSANCGLAACHLDDAGDSGASGDGAIRLILPLRRSYGLGSPVISVSLSASS